MGDIKEKNSIPGSRHGPPQATGLFRIINFELFVKPNKAVMVVGIAAFLSAVGYITYMKKKYEGYGYYPAIAEDGMEQYRLKQSKWD